MVKSDIQNYSRRLRLKELFGNSNDNDDGSIVRNKSDKTPKTGRDENLDLYIDAITKLPIKPIPCHKNISKNEKRALEELKNDPSTIYKESDKGGAIIVMDKDYYRDKIQEQLQDEEYYMKIRKNSDEATKRKIKSLVNEYKDSFTTHEIAYLCDFNPKESNFYGLPKIHKSISIQNAVKEQNSKFIEILRPTDLKFRPIVAGPESSTQRLSHFLDIVLKKLCPLIPSYIRDDMDFLKHVPENVPPNTILTSFDVTSLYTNIPNDLGAIALKYWIEKYRNLIESRFETDFLIKALKIVLEENTFYFNGQYFKQIKGTAMGSKVAPCYANLVMAYLEKIMYEQVENQYGTDFKHYILRTWKRFLDDCFVFWTKSVEELESFHNLLNSIHPSIQFTKESSNIELPFLDILLKVKDNKILTDIYYKKTDSHQYLNFASCHPAHTKRNIPYCLARRICAIVVDSELRKIRLEELEKYLREQNYPLLLIKDGIKKACQLSITELRTPKTRETEDIIPLVTTHDPSMPETFKMVKARLPILYQSDKMKELAPPESIINSRRQSKNLKRHLTKAKFDLPEKLPKATVCKDPRCGVCTLDNYNYLEEGSKKRFKCGKEFVLNKDTNCKSENMVYCITCVGCKENYIGQTGNQISERIRVHKQQIRHPKYRQIPLSKHLDECAGGKFKFFPLYRCINGTETYRKELEKKFIRIFKPKLNA